tara:strand:- start:51 stop:287 length:237 start_codon:yes stop_codon:yes gene_type:complete
MILLQTTLVNLPYKGKSESEALEIKEAIDVWFEKHPVYTVLLCCMPALAWALFVGIVKPGVKDDREIDYSSIERQSGN